LLILVYILELRYLPGKFSGCFAGGDLGMHYSPFTHTHYAYHEWGPVPGSV